ncbi:MAG: S8 family peptidase [Nitrospirales bacterium]
MSNSWGTRGRFSSDDPINIATKAAHDAGLVVVFAAGNDGPDLDSLNPYCVAPWVICVAAGHKDGRTLADFSSRGIPGDPLYHPTITAPGVDIAAARATTGLVMHTFFAVDVVELGSDAVAYTAASGTSMATPHVAGTAALMLAANPELTPDDVKALLQATVTAMPGYREDEVGAGYLNAFEAVSAAQPSLPTPAVRRFEETDPAVSYTGGWVPRGTDIATFSGGSAVSSDVAGATATLTFTGTAVDWIGLRCTVCGIAGVSIDGGSATTVNTAGPGAPGSGLRSEVVFTSPTLAAGSHTMVITVSDTTTSGGAHIVVDAFDVAS